MGLLIETTSCDEGCFDIEATSIDGRTSVFAYYQLLSPVVFMLYSFEGLVAISAGGYMIEL